jgi:predicted transcriptional regulator
MANQTPTTKDQARELLESLPDDATWDDIVYELAAGRSVALGLADAAAGRVVDASVVRRELRLRT